MWYIYTVHYGGVNRLDSVQYSKEDIERRLNLLYKRNGGGFKVEYIVTEKLDIQAANY